MDPVPMQGRCIDLLMIKTAGSDMDIFRVVGLFGGSITQLACCDFPSLGCEKGAMDRRHSGERGPWGQEEAGLCQAPPPDAPSPASLPLHQFRLPEVSQLRCVFCIITTINFQKCNCGSIAPSLDLLPYISTLCQALCLGWGDPVQALRKLVVCEEVFSGQSDFQHHSVPSLYGASSGCEARMLYFRPEF